MTAGAAKSEGENWFKSKRTMNWFGCAESERAVRRGSQAGNSKCGPTPHEKIGDKENSNFWSR